MGQDRGTADVGDAAAEAGHVRCDARDLADDHDRGAGADPVDVTLLPLVGERGLGEAYERVGHSPMRINWEWAFTMAAASVAPPMVRPSYSSSMAPSRRTIKRNESTGPFDALLISTRTASSSASTPSCSGVARAGVNSRGGGCATTGSRCQIVTRTPPSRTPSRG